MVETSSECGLGARFDWYAWSAPTHVGAEAFLRSIAAAVSARQRLRRLRVIGAALELDGAWLEAYEAGQNPGARLCRNAASVQDALRRLEVPHAVSLCEPCVFEFEDGSTLEWYPGWPDWARTGWNSLPAACTEGLNRQNFDFDRLFGRYLAGSWLQDAHVETETVTATRVRLSDLENRPERVTTIRRYVFVFANRARLAATTDGGGWYTLSLRAPGLDGTLPYLRFRAMTRPVVQPLLCHGGCGADAFGVYVRTNGGARAVAGPAPSFSMSGEVVENCLLAALARHAAPPAGAAQDCASGFDWYGSNLYSRDVIRRMVAELRMQAAALRRGEDTGAFRTLTARVEGSRRPSWLPSSRGGTASLPDLRAILADLYDRFCTRMEALARMLPDDGRIEILGL